MHNPIKAITDLGLSIASRTTAVLSIKYDAPFVGWNQQQFEEAIEQITGEPVDCEFTSLHDAKYAMMYYVQNLILHEKQMHVVDPVNALHASLHQSRTFQELNKIALSLEPGYHNTSSDGVTHRIGTKSEQAYQIYSENIGGENARATIIELFKSELNMSKGGATTYFHNTKKRYNSEC